MAYRLKQIRYQNNPRHILLQNENGPCPLLAAANCLLLKGSISLPTNCIGAGVVTIDQLVNVLAEKVLLNNQSGDSDHHIQEVLTVFPQLQYGMDVNPKFTAGPAGVEYTMQLNAFDLLHIELVHGWLLEPDAQEYEWIGNQTYNQLVNVVIQGNDASQALATNPQIHNHGELSTQATKGSLIHQFLERSAHQLTQYGLTVLHEYLKNGQMVVFFRNNHFNTLTKHNGLLYLLVTDFGYANVSSVVWEKIDVIDGDTEYMTEDFRSPPRMEHDHGGGGGGAATGEQMLANNSQSQADYQLALQLSCETSSTSGGGGGGGLGGFFNRLVPQQQDPEMEAARQASLLMGQGTVATLPGTTTTSAVPLVPAPPAMRTTTNADYDPALPTITGVVATIAPYQTPAFHNSSSGTLNVAVPVPVLEAPASQEDRDMMLAMQLQRQEESAREQRQQTSAADQRSRREEMEFQSQERKSRRTRVAQAGPPPPRLPTAPSTNAGSSRSNRGDSSNCVIS